MIPPGHTRTEVGDEILAILIAILMFFSIPNFPFIKKYFETAPYLIFGIALLLLIYRRRILKLLKVK
jgi:hypothetical protein